MEYSLYAKDLCKSYKDRDVVRGISLGLSKGECVGLLGPNGAGKTTLFYMICGLVRPDVGNVFLFGEDITSFPIYERCRAGIGYLAQEPSVFRKLSVYDNIEVALELSGYPKNLAGERVSEVLEMFNLSDIAHEFGQSLSGGQRRRVEVARCVAVEPSFVLLDEPFAGVDPVSVSDIKLLINRLKDLGIGVLITDHNVRDTLGIVDRAYMLVDGVVVVEGTSGEVIKNEKVVEKYLGEGFVYG